MKKFEVFTENMCNIPERLFVIQTFIFVKMAFKKYDRPRGGWGH